MFAGGSAYATWGETERPDAEGRDVTEPASKVPPPIFALLLGYEPSSAPYYAQTALTLAMPQTRLSESDRNDVRICEDGPEGCDEEPGWVDRSVRAGLELEPNLRLSLSVENLLDAGYKTFASGAYAPGRNFMIGVRGSI
jgi:outer membrane receptor protein involved in Fe transport